MVFVLLTGRLDTGVQVQVDANLNVADVQAGGGEITLSLTGDIWVAAGESFNAQRQAIINGLDSDAGDISGGWNLEVRDKMLVGEVVRTSDTVVTITLTAKATFAPGVDETITVTIPSGALVDTSVDVTASPSFTVTVTPPSVAMSGTMTSTLRFVQDIRDAGKTVVLTLTNASWVAAGGTFDAQRDAILNGLESNLGWANGWNVEVRDKAPVTDVVRTSSTVVTITLSAQAGYESGAEGKETITATVPASALLSGGPLVAPESFDVNYRFFDDFESYTVEVKQSSSVAFSTKDMDDSQGGPYTQSLVQNNPNAVIEIVIEENGVTPISDTKMCRFEALQADIDAADPDTTKCKIVKFDGPLTPEHHDFADGEIVSLKTNVYVRKAGNPWWNTAGNVNKPKFFNIIARDVSQKGMRLTHTGSSNTMSFHRNQMDPAYTTIQTATSVGFDQWVELEVRAKIGVIPIDDEETYPGAGVGLYDFDASANGWVQIMRNGTILKEYACTTRPGLITDTVVMDTTTLGLANVGKGANAEAEFYYDNHAVALVDAEFT